MSNENSAVSKMLDYMQSRDSLITNKQEEVRKELQEFKMTIQGYINETKEDTKNYRGTIDSILKNHETRILRNEIYDKVFFSALGAVVVIVPTMLAIITKVI